MILFKHDGPSPHPGGQSHRIAYHVSYRTPDISYSRPSPSFSQLAEFNTLESCVKKKPPGQSRRAHTREERNFRTATAPLAFSHCTRFQSWPEWCRRCTRYPGHTAGYLDCGSAKRCHAALGLRLLKARV